MFLFSNHFQSKLLALFVKPTFAVQQKWFSLVINMSQVLVPLNASFFVLTVIFNVLSLPGLPNLLAGLLMDQVFWSLVTCIFLTFYSNIDYNNRSFSGSVWSEFFEWFWTWMCCESRETEEMRLWVIWACVRLWRGHAFKSLHKPLVKHRSTTSAPWISCFYKDHSGQRKADVKVPSIAIKAWRPFKGILLSNLSF